MTTLRYRQRRSVGAHHVSFFCCGVDGADVLLVFHCVEQLQHHAATDPAPGLDACGRDPQRHPRHHRSGCKSCRILHCGGRIFWPHLWRHGCGLPSRRRTLVRAAQGNQLGRLHCLGHRLPGGYSRSLAGCAGWLGQDRQSCDAVRIYRWLFVYLALAAAGFRPPVIGKQEARPSAAVSSAV